VLRHDSEYCKGWWALGTDNMLVEGAHGGVRIEKERWAVRLVGSNDKMGRQNI